MTAEDIYRRLIEEARHFDSFDVHVLASLGALAFHEARAEGTSIVETIGLDHQALSRLFTHMFPHTAPLFLKDGEVSLSRSDDELILIDLLKRCGTTGSSLEALLAAMIARRALRPHHLWQDLGLQNREELSRLMARHFAPLSARNSKDMKWKKFLYRTICRDTAYSLCMAPSCGDCDDFSICFDEEAGESFLARIRRDSDNAQRETS